MILPSKNIAPDRALLTIAGSVFQRLAQPTTVSRLWDDLRETNQTRPISYSWFILAIDLLYLLNLVSFDQVGLLHRAQRKP